MYWPGTIAAAADAAGFEADSEPSLQTRVPAVVAQGVPVQGVARESSEIYGALPSGGGVGGVTPISRKAQHLPCAEDPDLFFAELPEEVETAKAMCHDCPVRLQCLSGALERREPWGVWGGELFLRGAVVPRKRPRGRPRKSEVAA